MIKLVLPGFAIDRDISWVYCAVSVRTDLSFLPQCCLTGLVVFKEKVYVRPSLKTTSGSCQPLLPLFQRI